MDQNELYNSYDKAIGNITTELLQMAHHEGEDAIILNDFNPTDPAHLLIYQCADIGAICTGKKVLFDTTLLKLLLIKYHLRKKKTKIRRCKESDIPSVESFIEYLEVTHGITRQTLVDIYREYYNV